MAMRSQAYDFACKWIPRFKEPDMTPDPDDPDFASELAALNSSPDPVDDDTNAAIRQLLSSLAVRWESPVGTAESGILDGAAVHEILERLARLADPSRFTGEPLSMYLVSHAAAHQCPEEDEEIIQRLRLHSNGWASVVRYAFSGDSATNKNIGLNRFRIEPELATELLQATAKFWRSPDELQPDRGSAFWSLTLTNTAYESYRIQAAPDTRIRSVCQKLSDRFRDSLGQEDLFLFDGGEKAERIERISVDYQRTTAGAHGVFESLVLDRAAGTLEQRQRPAGRRTVSRQITDKDGIRRLLDRLDPGALFSKIEGNPADVVPLPHESRDYHITVDFRLAPRRVIMGPFDRKGLPDDWDDFARKIRSFINSSGHGESFNPAIYGRSRRRRDELIFLSVTFPSSGKRYTYLGDDDSIEAGDAIIVPVGDEGRELPVIVERVDYCAAADAPYPLDKIKRMIRRCGDDEY